MVGRGHYRLRQRQLQPTTLGLLACGARGTENVLHAAAGPEMGSVAVSFRDCDRVVQLCSAGGRMYFVGRDVTDLY
jgi:hypothetical protein